MTLICTIGATFKTFGVTLTFTPLVLAETRISLRVATEVSEIDYDRQITLDGANIPGFRVRKSETTVELPSGAVLMTAGLIQQTSNRVVNGLPGLMNLPILGTLFRSRDYQRRETELMIIVSPIIAKPMVADRCGLWPQDLGVADAAFNVRNDPYWNLGCAMRSNMAAQVEDPVDLVRGRTESPPDTIRRMKVIEAIREGRDPSTQYRQERARINQSVGN